MKRDNLYPLLLLSTLAMLGGCGKNVVPIPIDSGATFSPQRCFTRHVIDDRGAGADGVQIVDINGDGNMDVVSGWEESAELKIYFHPGIQLVGEQAPWPSVDVRGGEDVSSIEDAAFADLDGDGMVDAVVSATEGTNSLPNRRIRLHRWSISLPVEEDTSWTGSVVHIDEPTERFLTVRSAQLDNQYGADIVAISRSLQENGNEPQSNASPGGVFYYRAPPLDQVGQTSAWKRERLAEVNKGKSIELVDMDADEDIDILYSTASNVWWLENPLEMGMGNKWQPHWIGTASDLALCDINNDGIQDVVATASRKDYPVIARWFQRTGTRPKPNRKWNAYDIRLHAQLPFADWQSENFAIKSIACAHIASDGDGPPDLALTTSGSGFGILIASAPEGFEQDYNQPWRVLPATNYQWLMKYDNILTVDMDSDGDIDLLTTEENEGLLLQGAGVLWYENTPCPE